MKFFCAPFAAVLTLLTLQSKAQFARKDYQTTLNETANKGLTELYFVGTGDIQLAYSGSASSDKKLAASTGLGVLFWRIFPTGNELQLDARINVASTVDTISAMEQNGVIADSRLFGRYVLVPAASGQATVISSLFYFNHEADGTHFVDGLELSGAASNQVWSTYSKNGAGTAQFLRSVNASVLALRVGAFHEFVPQDLRRKGGASIRFGLNGIVRSIQGDIGRHTEEMDRLREKFTLNKYPVHWGGEALLSLRLKNIRAEAAVPFIFTRGDVPASGLSGAQFITSISFVGGFPIRIGGSDD